MPKTLQDTGSPAGPGVAIEMIDEPGVPSAPAPGGRFGGLIYSRQNLITYNINITIDLFPSQGGLATF